MNDRDTLQTDTVALFYKEQFASADSAQLTVYHSEREFASGFEGVPIPYTPRADDAIAALFLIFFFVSAYILGQSKKILAQQFKDFFLHRQRTSIFAASTVADVRHLLLLVLQTCVFSGLCFFDYFSTVRPALIQQFSPHSLLVVYVAVCLLYVLVKWLFYSFVGWVFFDKDKTALWINSYFTIIYYVGFALFFFALFLIYFDLKLAFFIPLGLGLIISAKILVLYKWLKLFFNNVYGLLLLILYFCALEILPSLIVYQALVQINNLLLIKF
ncbi:DUF4271 domain-containing protein [uncultured Bacteroides sp.]|uniref:DUF4271 domain-containing protein n=1 Tax=uncultured Bacteroides sp. TaxID=162156 RepID=UPI002AA6CC99|nr:DUF4271 domain-containing protein [uncultured Bacteroides sp.]